MQEVNQIFAEEGLDLAFWFTFAGNHQPASTDPRRGVDLASYGLVSMLPEGPGRGYQDLGWRPRLAFETMAKLEAADSGQPPGPQGRARHGHKVPARSDQASSSSRRARN
jgi:hypothetical protein